MTLLKISLFRLDPQELEYNPMVQLSCVGCSNFLNNYSCPLFTPHVLELQSLLLRKTRSIIAVVAWFDLASRAAKLFQRLGNVKQALTLACLQLESYSRRVLNKYIPDLLKKLGDDVVAWLHPGGGCRVCRTCAAVECKPCRNVMSREPPAPEALGIDLYTALARRGIYIEHPPRRVVAKVCLVFLKKNITQSELDRLGDKALAVEKNVTPPRLESAIEQAVKKLEEEDRTQLLKVLSRCTREEVEVRPRECVCRTCVLRGSIKCKILRRYFERLAGWRATVLVIGDKVDLAWLRQSYMRHISYLCFVASDRVEHRRQQRKTVYLSLCRYVLGVDSTVLVTAIRSPA